MSRQTVYLLIITILLLIFVFSFAFFVLIPSGKEYRVARSNANKHSQELEQFQNVNDETQKRLNELEEKNKIVIHAFEHTFEPSKFIAENKKYFQNLTLTKAEKKDRLAPFDLYEVNATSKIDSPAVFYDFLDSLKKSNWVIGVNFPIHFQKEGEFIVSSFTMRVYTLKDDAQHKKIEKKEKKEAPKTGWTNVVSDDEHAQEPAQHPSQEHSKEEATKE
jgi:hypothetical protein